MQLDTLLIFFLNSSQHLLIITSYIKKKNVQTVSIKRSFRVMLISANLEDKVLPLDVFLTLSLYVKRFPLRSEEA